MSELQSFENLIGDNKVNIHDFADVSPKAELSKGVYVGSGAVIGPDVIVGPNTWIGPNVIIEGKVKIGSNNKIFPGACIGLEPQDLKYKGDSTDVLIGDNNTFREDNWRASHLRTFKQLLWNLINMEDLQDDGGEYYKTAYDQALMLPMLEMAGNKIKYVSKILHVYNRMNPNNVDKIKQQEQHATSQKIRSQEKYKRLF